MSTETNNTAPETTEPTTDKPKISRPHRTEEQRIADLKNEIAELEAASQEKALREQVKNSKEGSALVSAVATIDRAIRIANDLGNAGLLRAMEAARVPLGVHAADAFGIRLPETRMRVGGRKPKSEEVEVETPAA